MRRDLTIARGTGSYTVYEFFRSRASGEEISVDNGEEQVDDEDDDGIIDGGGGYAV